MSEGRDAGEHPSAAVGAAEAVLQRAIAGDEMAFATLLEDCRDKAWAVCIRICGSRHDAEDALQDASIAAWRSLSTFRGSSSFSTWFYRIAANAALQVVRRRRDVPNSDVPEPAHQPAFVERSEAEQVVRHALAQLRPEFRAALVLREWADLTYAEIAEWQDVPVQTVKSRLNRARNAISQIITDVG